MTTLVESSKEPESFVFEFLTPKCPFGSFFLKLFAYLLTFCHLLVLEIIVRTFLGVNTKQS